MTEFADVIEAVRRAYGLDLHRLQRKALETPSARAYARRELFPKLTGRSVLDKDVEVLLLATHDPLDDDPALHGPYPPGAVMLCTSVSARHARTGGPVDFDPAEADAWGLALAPAGFEDFALRLGTSNAFTTGVRHYRFAVATDGSACVIPAADEKVLIASVVGR